jgi:septal ring factor EnvC (AmiA/AmiB activator)
MFSLEAMLGKQEKIPKRQTSSVPKALASTEVDYSQVSRMIEAALKGISDEQKHLSKMQYETKTAAKKVKDEYQRLDVENAKINKKLADQARLFEKISTTSFKYHRDKAAVRHRELEYFTKRDFFKFMKKLRESLELIFKALKDAFKRDVKIAENLFETHFHPSGKGLTVST